MQRKRALGLSVLVCLTASSVNAAEAKKKNAEESQQQAQQAQQDAEALRQQAEAAQAEMKRLQAERDEAERKAQELQQQAAAVQEAKKPSGPEPSLNLPIRYYVYGAILGGLGYATGFLSRGPERDLRDPSKHPTQDKTQSLYRKAYYGGLISKGFYSLSGAMGGYAAYKTQSSVRQYFAAKAQMAARQKEAEERLAQARSSEERMAIQVTEALLEPSAPASSELLVMAPEPPPLQAGFIVGPSGEGALSFSLNF